MQYVESEFDHMDCFYLSAQRGYLLSKAKTPTLAASTNAIQGPTGAHSYFRKKVLVPIQHGDSQLQVVPVAFWNPTMSGDVH